MIGSRDQEEDLGDLEATKYFYDLKIYELSRSDLEYLLSTKSIDEVKLLDHSLKKAREDYL